MHAAADDGGGDAGRQVAVADQLDARAGGADVFNERLVSGPIEDDHHQILHAAAERLCDRAEVEAHGCVEIDDIPRAWTDNQLLHVDIRGMEQATALRRRQDRQRVGRARRAEVGALERIDGDVNLWIVAAVRRLVRYPDLFADVEHRRFVALALADDDGPVDRHEVHLAAHRFHRHVIRFVSIALAHRRGARDGCLFDDAKEVQRKV